MRSPSSIFDENPSVDGPDYVALVIEWDELADDLERQLRESPSSIASPPETIIHWPRVLGAAAGALGMAVLAWRIVRRLRA